MKIRCYILSFVFVILCMASHAQTAGSNEVSAIESKTKQHAANKKSIDRLKGELSGLEAAWQQKINAMKAELEALYKERDAIISDMKVGARCSQCNTYKSEFEKKGIDFQKHLGEVKGYAVPASTAELEAVRTRYKEKIALKKVQLQNLQKGDKALDQKKQAIADLENANGRICSDITAHSKSYENKVFAEGKAKHEQWVTDLMNYASDILIADDRITIYRSRISRLNKQFTDEAAKKREQIKQDNAGRQQSRKDKIAGNEEQVKQIKQTLEQELNDLKPKLAELVKEKDAVALQLKDLKLADSLKRTFTEDHKQLLQQIASLEKQISDKKKAATTKITGFETENKRLNQEIFTLTSGLAKEQEEAVKKLRAEFDAKIKQQDAQLPVVTAQLAAARKAYSERSGFYVKANSTYCSEIDTETGRMVTAGKEIDCPVWNDARGKVATNWNQKFPCVNGLTTMAKPYTTHVFGSYCASPSSSGHLARYKNFLATLDADDLAAVRGNSNSSWFKELTGQ